MPKYQLLYTSYTHNTIHTNKLSCFISYYIHLTHIIHFCHAIYYWAYMSNINITTYCTHICTLLLQHNPITHNNNKY